MPSPAWSGTSLQEALELVALETEAENLSARVLDMMVPIGKGQRGLIVSPSKAGKTMIMQSIANSITTNNPECHLMVVLVDERPPLSLTSDKSAESYRNWWPGPGDDMAALMNRSIDLMEDLARESDNVFLMNRRGYLFATAQPGQIEGYVKAAGDAAARPPGVRL